MELFNDHKKLFGTATLFFVGLTLLVAIIPALNVQKNNAVLPDAEPLTADAIKGKALYIANGCIGCHTQQVRNIDMDKVWGSRPTIAADYAGMHRQDIWRNTATLMGSERTGPDLINVGNRQASKDWQLVHLFNPRIVVSQSIMPAYSWLFEIKNVPAKGDVIVNVPREYLRGDTGKVVATKEALQLVAYLLSLKQTKLPDGTAAPDFLYKRKMNQQGDASVSKELSGVALYTANCQSCHQENGEGLKGAFPPLKGSKVVTDDNPELMVNIIMNGYTGREKEGFGPMPAVGTMNNLSAEEITAIMNHEKSSWGNDSKKVSAEEIKKVIDFIKSGAQK
jgi:cytochrome c oxidase cbb3-type subunit II